MSKKNIVSKNNVIVIGAGFSGLATAILLAKAGYQVKVLEKNETVGGRALSRKYGKYQFDLGPSWYLMPDVFDNFFNQINIKLTDKVNLIRLDPAYRIYYGRDHYIDLPKNRQAIDTLFDNLEPDGSAKLAKFLDRTKLQYDVAMNRFVYQDLKDWKTLIDPVLITGFLKLDILNSWSNLVKKYFNSPEIHKLLLYPAAFLGSAPNNTPAMYALLNYVDITQGVWYPQGGMGAIAKVIYQQAEKMGVSFHFNTIVTELKSDQKQVTEVITNTQNFKTDLVISTADYAHTELDLLKPRDQTYSNNYWRNKTLAPSGFVINLGLERSIKSLKHHNLFLLDDWEHHFDQVFKHPDWPNNPSFYVCAPTKTDKTLAPTNHEVLFILVPVAAGLADTPQIKAAFTQQILTKLEQIIGEKIRPHIKAEYIMSVTDFAENYLAYKGTTFGLAHTLWQTAFLRPKHQSQKLKNLYYAGQYTHPGVGVPTALVSGQITAELIQQQHG